MNSRLNSKNENLIIITDRGSRRRRGGEGRRRRRRRRRVCPVTIFLKTQAIKVRV